MKRINRFWHPFLQTFTIGVTTSIILLLAGVVGAGPILIASDVHGLLRQVDSSTGAIISTFGGPEGVNEIAFGPDGLIYGSDFDSSLIRMANPVTGQPAGTISLPANPRDLAFGPDAELYIALIGTSPGQGPIGIYRYILQTQQLTLFNTSPLNGSPIGMAFGPDNDLWVCLDTRFNGTAPDSVVRIDRQTGNIEGVFANENISIPQSLAFGPDGFLYVGNQGTNSITRYSSTGAYAGILTSDAGNPQGLYFLPNGDLIFGRGGSSFSRFNLTTNTLSDFSNGYSFSGGVALLPEPTGWLLVVIGISFVLPEIRRWPNSRKLLPMG